MADHSNDTYRRSFLKTGAGLMGSAALASGPLAAQRAGSPPRPNLIFMTTDGHRPDALSLNGNRILQTPNFDRIGREGVQFRNSFVTNALCLPSRATALTGLHTHNTGCVDNQNRAIPTDIPMFTDLLREAGYEVGLFGKAHVRDLDKRNFDYYFGYPGAATDYFWPVITEGSHGKVRPTHGSRRLRGRCRDGPGDPVDETKTREAVLPHLLVPIPARALFPAPAASRFV